MNLADMTMNDLGSAKKVVVSKDKTTIIDGAGDSAAVAKRASEIKATIENAKSDYDKKRLAERLGKLTNGVALMQQHKQNSRKRNYVSKMHLTQQRLPLKKVLSLVADLP